MYEKYFSLFESNEYRGLGCCFLFVCLFCHSKENYCPSSRNIHINFHRKYDKVSKMSGKTQTTSNSQALME